MAAPWFRMTPAEVDRRRDSQRRVRPRVGRRPRIDRAGKRGDLTVLSMAAPRRAVPGRRPGGRLRRDHRRRRSFTAPEPSAGGAADPHSESASSTRGTPTPTRGSTTICQAVVADNTRVPARPGRSGPRHRRVRRHRRCGGPGRAGDAQHRDAARARPARASRTSARSSIYVTDIRYREAVYRVMGRWLQGVYPVSTGLVVSGLARPEWLVEIDVTAVICAEASSRDRRRRAGGVQPQSPPRPGAKKLASPWLQERLSAVARSARADEVGNLVWRFGGRAAAAAGAGAHRHRVRRGARHRGRDGDELVGPGVGDNAAGVMSVVWAVEAMAAIPPGSRSRSRSARRASATCAERSTHAVRSSRRRRIALEGHGLDEVVDRPRRQHAREGAA